VELRNRTLPDQKNVSYLFDLYNIQLAPTYFVDLLVLSGLLTRNPEPHFLLGIAPRLCDYSRTLIRLVQPQAYYSRTVFYSWTD
jgi:hypothetical protein